jgi:hypothetical protein
MRKRLVGVAVLGGAFLIITLRGDVVAQQSQGPAAPPRNPTPASMPLTTLQDMCVRFPLPPGQEAYANIDGRHMHQYVVEQAAISRRYRDAGHPKFWGRIIGTSADAEDVEWMIAKFKAAGLGDVRSQPFDLGPQWFPQSWDVSVTGNGKTISLESAQPDYGATGTSAGGMDLDAVYVGLGSEADFVGRDVKGKAMFVFSMLGALNENAVRRADAKGAASIFEVNMLPGNARYQAYRSGTKAPAFTVGHDDGVAARDIIAAMSAGQSARESETRREARAEFENGPDLGDAAWCDRREDLHRLGQHLHAAGVVRGRAVAARAREDRNQCVQAIRRDDGSLSTRRSSTK